MRKATLFKLRTFGLQVDKIENMGMYSATIDLRFNLPYHACHQIERSILLTAASQKL